MPEYRCAIVAGGTFFLTIVTNDRRPFLTTDLARQMLRTAVQKTRQDRSFEIEATVLLPDHWHCIWMLPDNDTDFSTRMRLIKGRFTHEYLAAGGSPCGVTRSRERKEERGLWQRRFFEHLVRDEVDFERICNYIHYNPVKHGLASCPHAWPYSSFHRFVNNRRYGALWQCVCKGRPHPTRDFEDVAAFAGE